jgi:DNA-binding NarL/FixJ family response regulator
MNTQTTNSGSVAQETRVLLVDDHPLVRMSLREVLRREPNMVVCGEAEDRDQALELATTTKPHLAVVDLTLKSSSGLDLIKDFKERFPNILVLVLSMHDEMLHAERAIRAGARGYVTKHEAAKKIITAIQTVLSGEIYWSERAAARVASKVAKNTISPSDSPLDVLADRELQVFELIGAGQSTRQIAAALHINVSTVETYRARIKEKLNLDDSLALLQFAIRWHISGKSSQ